MVTNDREFVTWEKKDNRETSRAHCKHRQCLCLTQPLNELLYFLRAESSRYSLLKNIQLQKWLCFKAYFLAFILGLIILVFCIKFGKSGVFVRHTQLPGKTIFQQKHAPNKLYGIYLFSWRYLKKFIYLNDIRKCKLYPSLLPYLVPYLYTYLGFLPWLLYNSCHIFLSGWKWWFCSIISQHIFLTMFILHILKSPNKLNYNVICYNHLLSCPFAVCLHLNVTVNWFWKDK